jgi:hypothetical protein
LLKQDTGVISWRSKNIIALSGFVPDENIIFGEHELRVYECDGLSAYRRFPWR